MDGIEHLPESVPILELPDAVVFPLMVVPLSISRNDHIKLIDDVVSTDPKILMIVRGKGEEESHDIEKVGVVCTILRMMKTPEREVKVLIQALRRARIDSIETNDPYLRGKLTLLSDHGEKTIKTEALIRNVRTMFSKLLKLSPQLPEEVNEIVKSLEDPSKIADFIAANIPFSADDKQAILETLDINERLEKLLEVMAKEIGILQIGSKIRSQVKEELDKDQREYFLREQLKAIKKELGEDEDEDIKDIEERLKEKELPEKAREIAEKELERLRHVHRSSAEYNVIRTYLEWILDLPWVEEPEEPVDIEEARKILDKDHFDLERIKDRIIEFLAVRSLNPDGHSPILCFVGPPGVGKTSLGRSIARALNRKFARIALGGVRDEAEIRGHRRTYVGAMPGRIIQEIKRAGTKKLVFMLDEIDKVGSDFRGDPASALLEVLDPEQNDTFQDHYLDIPYDLSKIMFITTANILDTIPPPLRDRMEIISLPGYTYRDKLEIGRRYLVPKQIKENGLTRKHVSFLTSGLKTIINKYTAEAGVRNFEREIGNICRKIAVDVASGKWNGKKIKVDSKAVKEFLGPPRIRIKRKLEKPLIGVVTGLAWTPVGGTIIFVEAKKMKGSGKVILTGSLGDVMKESAETAISYIRSKADEFGIDPEAFLKCDIHIHVPEGATPKDGPSAGITMATAIYSLFVNRPVRNDIAMTGEITLRGDVTPIGGIKEKTIGALMAGIKRIILPYDNVNDLEDIPDYVRKDVEYMPVKTIDEVFNKVIIKGRKK